jgi:hypothetical protein
MLFSQLVQRVEPSNFGQNRVASPIGGSHFDILADRSGITNGKTGTYDQPPR